MSGVLHGVIASLKTAVAVVTDAYFKYVSLLLNTTSTNGAQNNTFLDSSTNAFSVTRNGDTTQGSFNPYMPTGYWSGYFDGAGDFLSVPDDAAFLLTGDFTVEAWIYQNSSKTVTVIGQWATGGNTSFVFFINSAAKLTFSYKLSGGPEVSATASTNTIEYNTWNHVVWVRSGTTVSYYINGVQDAITNTLSGSFNNSSASVNIGLYNTSVDSYFNGYISNLRFVNGTAVYTANFTPPTTPLTAISGTSLLCLQDNRFIDNSTNAFAITRNGDTRISKFAPFNPPASYSTATYGGSGYFDGTGDDLRLSTNAAFALGTGDFTFEAWINPSNWTNAIVPFFVVSGTGGFWVGKNSSNFVVRAFNVADQLTYGTLPTVGAWTHIVAVRSGTTLSMYYNGTRVAFTTTNSYNFAQAALAVGSDGDTVPLYYTGYISNARLVKGTAVYDPTQTTLTVPTTPLTAITNTSLLLNFDNAGIYDATTINDVETEGNAQVSTTQAKFGTTSMYFDGTGDYLQFPNDASYRFGTGDFTVEFWINTSDTNFNICGLVTGSTGNWMMVVVASQLYWQTSYGVTNLFNVSATPILNGAWHHVAVTRNGTSTRLFFDGVAQGSSPYTDNTNYSGTGALRIGSGVNGELNGYIDDLRITKGYARYTGNFTPPTAAFPTL